MIAIIALMILMAALWVLYAYHAIRKQRNEDLADELAKANRKFAAHELNFYCSSQTLGSAKCEVQCKHCGDSDNAF